MRLVEEVESIFFQSKGAICTRLEYEETKSKYCPSGALKYFDTAENEKA